jgi:hypothetical protein
VGSSSQVEPAVKVLSLNACLASSEFHIRLWAYSPPLLGQCIQGFSIGEATTGCWSYSTNTELNSQGDFSISGKFNTQFYEKFSPKGRILGTYVVGTVQLLQLPLSAICAWSNAFHRASPQMTLSNSTPW